MKLIRNIFGLLNAGTDHGDRVFGLDLMRAIAITSVVLAHSRGLLAPLELDLEFLKFFAFAGVEIFFVLSGFLIGTILIRIVATSDAFAFGELRSFWIRRWFRTLPNYFLILIILLILHQVLKDPVPFDWRYWLFLQNFATPHPAFFGEAWSLSVEEWFYVLFPLGVFIACSFMPGGSSKTLILAVILLFIIGFNLFRYHYSLHNDPEWNLGVRRMVMCRLDSIIYGVLGAWLAYYHRLWWERIKKTALAAGMVLMSFCVWVFFTDLYPSGMAYGSLFADTFYFTVFSIAVACFLPVLSGWKAVSPSLVSKSVTHMSLVSYSVYLVHFALVFKAFKLLPASDDLLVAVGKYMLYWVVVMVVASVNYRYFEYPVTRLRNRFGGSR